MKKKQKDEKTSNGGRGKEGEKCDVIEEVERIMKSGDTPIVLGLERQLGQSRISRNKSTGSGSSDASESDESQSSGSESSESSDDDEKEEKVEVKKEVKKERRIDDDVGVEVLDYTAIGINDWFKHIVGEDEEELRDIIDKKCPFECECIKESSPVSRQYTSMKIRNLSDPSKVFNAGLLYIITIKDLQKAVIASNEKKAADGKLNTYEPVLTFEYADDQESRKYVDVSLLQSNPENAGSMFQVASNFNGVEGVSETTPPDSPLFVTKYIKDQTQGPAASISAGPAAIARVFAPLHFLYPKKKPHYWQQTYYRQLNMLAKLKDYYHVENGYVINSSRQKPIPEDPKAVETLIGKVNVLVHADVDVVFGRRQSETLEVLEAPVKVSQVFCSSMNMAQGSTGMTNAKLSGAAAKARLLLEAAYMGTYLAAIDRGCTKLYLTLVGGGVFGNKQKDILDIIIDTHKKIALNKKYNSCIKEVHLPLFSVPARISSFFVFIQL